MIQGIFGEDGELFFEIELVTANQLELAVDAMLDTGFSGWLAINSQDLDGLEWEYVRKQNTRLAQGETFLDIYVGKVRIDGQEFDIPVYVGTEISEVLLGRQWLKTRRLIVDIPSGILILGQ